MSNTGILEFSRIYKNSTEDTIRIDTIRMTPTQMPSTVAMNASFERTYARTVEKAIVLGATSDRVVASVEIITDADQYEAPGSGAVNYNWVAWTRLNNLRCNMSDLPQIGDTV